MRYQPEHMKPVEHGFMATALSGRAARFVVAAGLAGAIASGAPALALADEADATTPAAAQEEAVLAAQGTAESTETTEGTESTEGADAALSAAATTEQTEATNSTEAAATNTTQAEATNTAAATQTEEKANTSTEAAATSTSSTLAAEATEAAATTTTAAPAATQTQAVVAQADDTSSTTQAQATTAQSTDSSSTSSNTSADATTTNDAAESNATGQWVVDSRSGSLERYWVYADGTVAKNTLITPEDGAGYYAYATASGAVVRGKYDTGTGLVYVADQDGRLLGSDLAESGWIVTDAYDGGWQRYYIDADARAARSGFFSVDGYGDVFGKGGQGYVVRGDFEFGGQKWSSDNEGILRSGWYVTSGFGQGLQRYWMGETYYGSAHAMAKDKLVGSAGYYGYATSDGTVLRGRYDTGAGRVYVADNDGKLLGSDLTTSGWVVTNHYDGRYERYWVDASMRAAVSGLFTVNGYGDVFGRGNLGYVARGDFKFADRKWSADNEGKLRSGWYVTNGFGDGLQRYWMGDTVHGSKHAAAVNRLVTTSEGAGYYAYATGNATILRGKYDTGAGRIYVADNEGKLLGSDMSSDGWVVTQAYDGGWQRYYVDAAKKAAVSGYFTVDGNAYWGLANRAYVARNTIITYNGKYYKADNDGVLTETKIGWYTENGKRYYAREDGSVIEVTDAGYAAWQAIQGYSSGTGYIMAIDNSNYRTFVFTGSQGNWMPYADWIATVGTTPEKGGDSSFGETFRGVSAVRSKGYMMGNCPYEFYWTEFYINSAALVENGGDGEGQRFHSILYWDQGMSSVYDGTLGAAASHGCVRLATENAKWVYDNIPLGTTVWSY